MRPPLALPAPKGNPSTQTAHQPFSAERVATVLATAPAQARARLHVAAATPRSAGPGGGDGSRGRERSREATRRRQAPVLFSGQSLRLGQARAITTHAPFGSR